MATEFELLLDQASAFLGTARPETVTIAGFPVPLDANVAGIYRRDVMTDTGFRKQERGTVEIRRAVLATKAPGVPDPASHTEIVVRGTTYRIDFCTGDPITLRIEFASFNPTIPQ